MIRGFIGKFKILIAAEAIIILAAALIVFLKGSYSFTLSPSELIFTQEAVEIGYVSGVEGGLFDVTVPEEDDLKEFDLCMWKTHLPRGVYEAEISYSTVYNTETENKPLVKMITFDETGETSFFSDDMELYDFQTLCRSRIYVSGEEPDLYSFFVSVEYFSKRNRLGEVISLEHRASDIL